MTTPDDRTAREAAALGTDVPDASAVVAAGGATGAEHDPAAARRDARADAPATAAGAEVVAEPSAATGPPPGESDVPPVDVDPSTGAPDAAPVPAPPAQVPVAAGDPAAVAAPQEQAAREPAPSEAGGPGAAAEAAAPEAAALEAAAPRHAAHGDAAPESAAAEAAAQEPVIQAATAPQEQVSTPATREARPHEPAPQEPAPEASPAEELPAQGPAAADAAAEAAAVRLPRVPAAGGGRSVVPTVLVGLLALALLAATVVLGLRLRDAQQTQQAREEATAASRDAARVLFSYDHAQLDEDFARGLAVTTGEFTDEYRRTTEEVVTPVAVQYKAVVVADVVESAVVEAEPDEVVALVFLNQATTSTRVTGQQVDQSRVRMRLVERDGRWLVSEVTAL